MQRRSSELSSAVLSFPELSTNENLQKELESFISNIVKEYILSWYYSISTYPVFPRIMGEMFSRSFLSFSECYKSLNIENIIITDFLTLIKHHISTYHIAKDNYSLFPTHSLDSYFHAIKPHPALDHEQEYIREYSKRIAQNCLNDTDRNCQTVHLLTIDIIASVLESIIESLSRPDMLYSLLESILINIDSNSDPSLPKINFISILKNCINPTFSNCYADIIDLLDIIFKIKDRGDIPNPHQSVWTVYFSFFEPILCGLFGNVFNDFVIQNISDILTPDLLASLVSKINDFLFKNEQIPKMFVLDEEYEFVPYGKQRRILAQLINEKMPLLLVDMLGGKERLNLMLDRNLLAVFASKQRNKHLIYGVLDIIIHHGFCIRPKRTKSIKYTNSQLRIPEMKAHRQSYSTSIGQSYKGEYMGKS